MVRYRRYKVKGGTYFFTVALLDRKSTVLTDCIVGFRESLKRVLTLHPFKIHAIVVLPDHFHAIWEMPDDDDNFSIRMRLLKNLFTRYAIKSGYRIGTNLRGEKNFWQRRFWEHVIRDEKDFENHVNYIHYNPVKHGLVERVIDWPYSSFHRYVQKGILTKSWGSGGRLDDIDNE
ncbi:MAG TPA: transposase [Gammaproteobacteria bacterium]|jgi:putative transposase|nr:transposase [Gammaproteobacteria bacterium]